MAPHVPGVDGAWMVSLKKYFYVEHPPASEDTDEADGAHLTQVAFFDPQGTVSFIRNVTRLSTGFTLATGVVTLWYLLDSWSRCESCNRPFRWWLLIHSILQVLQLPMRFATSFLVHAAQEAGESISDCVTSITASPAWSWSKALAVAHYFWIILGVVWWMHLETSPSCPDIGDFTVVIILSCVVRAVAAMVLFRIHWTVQEDPSEAPKPVGASKNQIADLPMVRLPEIPCGEEAPSCSICLVDFIGGEVVRKLPCGHYFHDSCIDSWLGRNKNCPLCITPIDEVRPSNAVEPTCGACTDGHSRPCRQRSSRQG